MKTEKRESISWQALKGLMCCLLAVSCLLSSCGIAKEPQKEETKIWTPDNHLEQWKQELPGDTEPGGIEAAEIRGLQVQKEGETVAALSYEPREGKETFDYWDISVPYHSLVSVNTEELYRLLGTAAMIGGARAEGISRKSAGINGSNSVFLAYCRQDAGEKGAAEPTRTQTILIGKADGQGNYYAALGDSEDVFCISCGVLDEFLEMEPYQYILKIPVLLSVDTVRKIQIISDGRIHYMEQGEERWSLDGQEISQKEYQSLYSALLDMMLTGEKENDAHPQEKQEPVLNIQFLRNTKEAPDVEVKYYEYDDTAMSVSVNGQEMFLVERDAVLTLKEKFFGS